MIVELKHHTHGGPMQRATITLDDEFVAELDRIIALRGYQNRSEAIRDLARAGMRQAAEASGESGQCDRAASERDVHRRHIAFDVGIQYVCVVERHDSDQFEHHGEFGNFG